MSNEQICSLSHHCLSSQCSFFPPLDLTVAATSLVRRFVRRQYMLCHIFWWYWKLDDSAAVVAVSVLVAVLSAVSPYRERRMLYLCLSSLSCLGEKGGCSTTAGAVLPTFYLHFVH